MLIALHDVAGDEHYEVVVNPEHFVSAISHPGKGCWEIRLSRGHEPLISGKEWEWAQLYFSGVTGIARMAQPKVSATKSAK
jgi:hypothetical protein